MMIRVLFFIHDLGGGGAEKVLVNLVNNMDKNKFEITLLTMFDNGINRQYLSDDINYKYIFKKVFRGNQHIFKIFSPKFLYKIFIKDEYDVIISYMQGATTRIISGCSDSNVIKLNWIHTEMTKSKLAYSYRSYKEYVNCYKQFDATVFVAESAKNIFEKETGLKNNNVVKYNTVDIEEIISGSKESLFDVTFKTEIMNLITVGRFTKEKGYFRLLGIIKRLAEENYEFHFYILGKGPLKNKINDYIRDNNLNDYISLLGYKENPYKYVKNADWFVCSSYHEGYSTVITESLIVGTPVLSTLCSGTKEQLGEKNEYGIIVDNNKNSLYEGIKNILENEDLYTKYKKQAKKRSNYFSKERTVNEVESLIVNLINYN